MTSSQQTVYRMTLSQFYRYLKDKGQELKDCYKEIEEIQYQFNDIFKRELAAWQEVFAYCFPLVLQQRRSFPASFQELVDRTEQEELARIRQEIVELGKTVVEGRAEADEYLSRAQAATQTLRQANPTINDREERLKARMVAYQEEFARAYEEMEKLRASPLGGLRNWRQIRKAKRVQRVAKNQQTKTLKKLRQVREEWLERVNEAGDTQAELRGTWQGTSVQVSRAQGQREHLQANLENLAEQAAIQRVLEELDHDPQIGGELGQKLIELAKRNRVRLAYEEGLRAVAEALGLIKGVGEGMQRFRKSVGTVVEEQRRFNLAQVHVLLPRPAAILNQTWKLLGEKVRDEKHMGTHPLEFSKVVDTYITKRLTDASIQQLFEGMGEALSKATAAW